MKNMILSDQSSFKEAIKILDQNGHGFLAVTNKNNQLIGILTDGDVRRAILNDKTELLDIINKNPVTMLYGVTKKQVLYELKKLYRKHMPIVDKKGILKDVVILDEAEFDLKPNWVVIMAGGLGTRLGELTKDIPKPMLPVNNQPILKHIIDQFVAHGFTKFMLSVNYKAQVIKDYFKDGSEFGIQITYLEETKKLGTGGALSCINIDLKEPFFVTNGDVLASLDYETLLNYHYSTNSLATMCIRKSSYQVPYGVIDIDESNNILGLNEKPIYQFFINTGVYVLDPKVLSYVPRDEFFDLPELFRILNVKGFSTKSYEIKDYWVDMGRPEDYASIQKKLTV